MKTNANENGMNGMDYRELLKGVSLGQLTVRSGQESKIPNVNFYNYVGKDELRPVMSGVFHQNGYKVATDSHILIAVKDWYDEENEGKIIAKDGSIIEGKYPKWESVISDIKGLTERTIDLNKFFEFVKNAKKEMKENKELKKESFVVEIDKHYFRMDLFGKLADLMKRARTSIMYLSDDVLKAATFKTDDAIGMIMPIILPERKEGEELTLSVCAL